ncbi:MAG: AAA family ATPase [Acholeplasmatales bacterium]|nr:AAA family ATPase [Acholeplasmatales bacterium]
MKILSLYIDSFGKLSDYLFDFTPKMNSIYEENGWGKTTMTVFIKTMLYGFTNKSERERYTPWNNKSSFGGTMKIEVNGKKYRIDRRFDPKKASNDVLNVYDLQTNLEVDFGNNIGEKILNLNVDSFERSVFIPQKELEEGFGSDIEAKLANLIGGTNDSQSFDDAVEILNNKSKLLRMNSKKGLIIDKKRELSEIQNEIEECNNKLLGINDIEKQIDIIKSEITGLNEKKKEINEKIIKYSKEQEKKTKLAVAKKYYEDIQNTKETLDKNNEIFNGINLTAEDVLAIRSKNKELISLKYEYEIKQHESGSDEKLDEFKNSLGFKDDLPTNEEIDNISKKIQKYQNIKGVINAHTAEPVKTKPIVGVAALIVSGFVFVCGVISLLIGILGNSVNKQLFTNIGIIVMIVALLGIILGLTLVFINYSHNQSASYTRVKNYDFELREIESQIRDFFGRFHLYSSEFSNNLYTVKSNLERYKEAQVENSYKKEENSKLERKMKEYETIIQDFLKRFKTTAPTTEEQIGELNTHLRRKAEIENNLVFKETSYKQYIALHGLSDIDENEVDVDSLNSIIADIEQKIQELAKELTTKSNKVVEYESEIIKLDDLVEKEEELTKEIKNLEHEYDVLITTEAYLKKAQTSLLEKYVKPMKDSVDKYVSLLLKNNKEYNIDVNFKFQFITKNGLKGIDQYSRGYQTIITLCMRLALIDCLYPNEKPFVIFDDPFVNFDDEKLDLCKNLMNDISSHYQIIYFTCHDSRVIK